MSGLCLSDNGYHGCPLVWSWLCENLRFWPEANSPEITETKTRIRNLNFGDHFYQVHCWNMRPTQFFLPLYYSTSHSYDSLCACHSWAISSPIWRIFSPCFSLLYFYYCIFQFSLCASCVHINAAILVLVQTRRQINIVRFLSFT